MAENKNVQNVQAGDEAVVAEKFQWSDLYKKEDWWAIWLGFIGYPMWLFLGVSAIFRTGRFAIIGALLYYFQEQANTIVKKYFWPLTFGAIIAAGLGIFLISLF